MKGKDVTATEKKLFEKIEDLETIFNAIPDLFFRLDEKNIIIDYYAGEASDLYVPPEEFMNKNMLKIFISVEHLQNTNFKVSKASTT